MTDDEWLVVWHRENENGEAPIHEMGVEAFRSRGDAIRWVDCNIDEMMRECRDKETSLDEVVDDEVYHAYADGVHKMFKIVESPRTKGENR